MKKMSLTLKGHNSNFLRFSFLLIAMLMLFVPMQAQNAGKGVITGKIIDVTTNSPVEYATVSLLSAADSSLVTGAISDANGIFKIEKLAYQDYMVKIAFIGFEQRIIDNVSLSKENAVVNLSEVQLSESVALLDEVTVTEERNLVVNKLDKKIFNVSKNETTRGSDALEVLRNVPSVDVDQDGNVSLRGNNNVTILIDGRPSGFSTAATLRQITAEAIENVEVVTNPSAKYDAEGMSGIINIVLKKNSQLGINGNTSVNYTQGKESGYSGNVGINMRNSKVNVFTNYNYNNRNFWSGGNSITTSRSDLDPFYLDAVDNTVNSNESHFVRGGIDFFVNDNHTIYTSASYRTGDGGSEQDNINQEFDEFGMESIKNNRFTSGTNPSDGYEVNAGWQMKFSNDGQTLDLDAKISNNEDENTEEYRSVFFRPGFVSDSITYQNGVFGNFRDIVTLKADYVHPFSNGMSLELGAKSELADQVNSVYYEDLVENVFVPDEAQNNTFDYNRDIHAAYVILNQEFEKWSYKVGVRAEQSEITGRLAEVEDFNVDDSYLDLFPSVFIGRNFNEGESTSLSYSRRINRPRLHQLNPFANNSDPYFNQLGNSNLQPEYIHVVELGYSKTWEKVTINPSIYYRRVNDLLQRRVSEVGDNVSELTWINLDNADNFGVEFITSLDFVKWLSTNLTINYWNQKINSDDLDEGANPKVEGVFTQISNRIKLPKGMSGQVSARYRPGFEWIQGRLESMFNVDVALRIPVLERKGSIGIRAGDILGTQGFSYTSRDTEALQYDLERNWDSQNVNVSFSYNFGKRIKGPQKRRGKNIDANDGGGGAPGF